MWRLKAVQMAPEQGSNWGIMGGIFDPVHYGHLRLAENALETFDLDGILFLVSFNPPHRKSKPVASFEDRLMMTEMAVKGNDRFIVSDIEKEIEGDCYTINIVSFLKDKYPGVNWRLILGADNIAIFDSWYKPDELLSMVRVGVGARPGFIDDLKQSRWSNKIDMFEMQILDISSTLIRNSIASKKSIKYLLPEEIRQYIYLKGLYQ